MADDDDSSSSSSDEEFLTIDETGGNKNLDRDALVRKKLLENFYGKSAVAAAQPAETEAPLSDDDLDLLEDSSPAKASSGDKLDLDAPNFDALAHTERHVVGSDVHELLETDERLALQVRTLDSTMQTLVYENYSRFIDATDAIRSIGVNVSANEDGLQRLIDGMQTIDATSRAMEESLGDLRDQVAEKIRVKRLLTRLDALLKLPKTLQEQIAAGKYRTATRSYLSASSILRKHSEGFESLKTIEQECNSILTAMHKDLKVKLLHWSGGAMNISTESDPSVPDPPKSMSEIFECAGTLYILCQAENDQVDSTSQGDEQPLDADDLQSMAISAVMRLLDRLLDTHLIEVQERRFAAPGLVGGGGLDAAVEPDELMGSALIPTEFLDAVLEAASLYGLSFGTDGSSAGYLMDFVSEAFATGLSHVRSVLLEESTHLAQQEISDQDADASEVGGEADYSEITGALSIYVQSVRQLATGLTLPEVGIGHEFSTNLVDQAMDLTESMLRRRVDQNFHDLRFAVAQNCLIPFVERATAERESAEAEGKSTRPHIVQLASSTLSDCLQLLDDTIRSTSSTGMILDESSTTDLRILKEAVEASTQRFTSWLASSLEILAGGESSDPNDLVEAPVVVADESEGAMNEEEDISETDIGKSFLSRGDDFGDVVGQDDAAVRDMVDKAHQVLQSASDGAEKDMLVHADFTLALAEMCRLGERSVADNLDQSIKTHLGAGRKKTRGLFPSGEGPLLNPGDRSENDISKRFQLAASRILVIYGTNCGMEAASRLCEENDSSGAPKLPRSCTWEALAVVKASAIECAELFGGSKRAGPVPEMETDAMSGITAQFGRKTGLQLDVERMFKEKVTILPHPSESVSFARDDILFLVMKVAFRALVEQARMSTFSPDAFQQLQVDTEFLKHMIPHYVSGDACTSLSSLLTDAMTNAGERCTDESCAVNDDMVFESKDIVRSFMADLDSDIAIKFVIDGVER